MRWSSHAAVLAAIVLLRADLVPAAGAQVPPADEERDRIIALGPWPRAPARDPSNRVSGNAAAISFGRRMFHETRLSANGYISCVACHQTTRAWTDAIARAQGLAPVDRNTPSLLNASLNSSFGWTGASDSLWMASLRPMLDAREIGSSAAKVAHVVHIGDGLACEYKLAFGRAPEAVDDETVMVDVAKAIAAFVETLQTGRTAFDDYRDGLARNDPLQIEKYPPAAARGARLFVGRARCVSCHSGATFSNGSFHAVTGPTRGVGVQGPSVGRYSLAGPFNDDRGSPFARTNRAPTSLFQERGRYRVPSLRNVAVTPPYLHDGSRETLREAAQHDGAESLSADDVDDLVAFLVTLTDTAGAQRPIERPGESTCH